MIKDSKLPDNIDYCQVTNLTIGHDMQSVEISFIDPASLENYSLKFDDVCFFSLSKYADDNGAFQIGAIELALVDDGDKLISDLGYKITPKNKIGAVHYLRIDGAICLDLVSKA